MMFLLGSQEYINEKVQKYPMFSHFLPFSNLIYAYQPNDATSVIRFENDEYEFILSGKLYGIPAESIPNLILSSLSSDFSSIYKLDGDFLLFLFHKSTQKYHIFADRIGILPCYYSFQRKGFIFTSYPRILFDNFSEDDIDLSSIHDFLCYGTLLGNHTFSQNVKCLNGGTYISIEKQTLSFTIDTQSVFKYSRNNYEYDKQKLIKNISASYKNAVKKRISDLDIEDSCIFLSGGLDSRLLLAAVNRLTPKRISCYTFGQVNSEEADIARRVSCVYGNPYTHIITSPQGFLNRTTEYITHTCGNDMFPQSYILNAIEQIPAKNFMTGYILDVLLGGTFLDQQAVESSEKFSDFITQHPEKIKMNVFSNNDFDTLCSDNHIFLNSKDNLYHTATMFDDCQVSEIIQLFGIYNRDIRLVLNREFVPGLYMHEEFPSTDIEFLNNVAKIPPEYKLDHAFYRELFLDFSPEYCEINYNNTGLPVSAPLNLWKKGTALESQREALFSEIQKSNIYYPHFYSDFDGYSRYDKQWKSLFNKYLLSPSAYILKWFKLEEIINLYNDHITLKKNNRKKLVYLLSLELFFQVILFSNEITI